MGSYDASVMILSIDQAKVLLTFNAFLFDLYKWCVFITATSQDVVTDGEDKHHKK